MKLLFLLSAVLLLINTQKSFSAYCNGSPQPGDFTNDNPILDTDLTFVKSIKNAKLYKGGPSDGEFNVLHLWGTPYEMGFAQGTIIKNQVREFVYKTWAYLSQEIVSSLDGDNLSPAAKEILVLKGVDAALDWTSATTGPFTSQSFYDEVKGLADASGVSYDLLWRLQMFPELTKASCSFFGVWGSSVKTAGHAYQLRALDYDMDGPFKDYPLVTIYHPNEGSGHAFSQVGWPGSIGALTGYSSKKIAISEIGVSYPDDSFGQGTDDTPPEKVKGTPWMFLARDVLQYDGSMDDAKLRITNASRTCNLIIGLGDGNLGKSNGCEYSGYVANFYDDKNQLPVNDTWHQVVEDTVYNGMDWNCPSYTGVLGDQLSKYHGVIDENIVIGNILPTVQTGNLHIAVYDLTDMHMHVSFARRSTADQTEPLYAYQRQFTRLHMDTIFAEQAPVE